jgi:hypothetical protein
MASAKLSGLAIAEGIAGFALLWSGLKNQSIGSVLKEGLSGNLAGLEATGTATTTGTPVIGVNEATTPTDLLGPGSAATSASAAPPAGTPATDLTGSASANQALGKLMAAAYGWGTGQNWQALNYGWGTLESGWRNTVYNGGTVGGPYQPDKAYGIPQALGHGPDGAPFPKGNAGNPPGAGGSSSAASQIAWGLSYIKDTYGSPSKVPGWLGQGGYVGY